MFPSVECKRDEEEASFASRFDDGSSILENGNGGFTGISRETIWRKRSRARGRICINTPRTYPQHDALALRKPQYYRKSLLPGRKFFFLSSSSFRAAHEARRAPRIRCENPRKIGIRWLAARSCPSLEILSRL